MRKPHIDVGQQRRAQIVEAAVGVIADAGLPALSLSAIEQRAGMSRGQLTYYFGTKEDILLAVFDHMLRLLRERAEGESHNRPETCIGGHGWERLRGFLNWFILDPPTDPDFHALQHTFLSQIGHRDDFRQRLADVYEEWRRHIAGDVAEELSAAPATPAVSARTVASLVVAIVQGLRTQAAANAEAYDRQEMLTLVLHLLGGYLKHPVAETSTKPAPTRNGRSAGAPRKTPKA
jgi:AcrR family transcriptional regulator